MFSVGYYIPIPNEPDYFMPVHSADSFDECKVFVESKYWKNSGHQFFIIDIPFSI